MSPVGRVISPHFLKFPCIVQGLVGKHVSHFFYLSALSISLFLFSSGNDRFVQVSELNADQIAESLTIFNLVQPKYIPRLFDLFALALRGGSPPPLVLQQSPLAPGNMLGRLNSKLSASRGGSTVTDEGESAALSGIEGGNHGTNDDSSMSESRSTVVSSSGQEEEEEDGDECDKRNEEEAEENDGTEYHHASMTVPCAHFPSGQALFLMTVSGDPASHMFNWCTSRFFLFSCKPFFSFDINV